MTVTNLTYFSFVMIVWLLSLVVRSTKAKQVLLLVASYVFYASWGVWFLLILIASSLGNYWFGRLLRRKPSAGRLVAGVAFNVLLLICFKYLPSFAGQGSSWLAGWLMPVGISFWTFEALSYLFDLYREEELDPTLTEFCLYLSFWPTVLTGPVCRLPNMLPQLRSLRRPRWEQLGEGARRILIGLFMKLFLAHLLMSGFNPGEGVASGFDQVSRGWGGIDAWMLAIGFGFQLFFDFAGYSHIVIGTAILFGLQLEENFDRPFLATTPSQFWTRWHMSLSFWIRDYVFLPLATVRREHAWRLFALVLSMTLFGLWHGATLTFILWGVCHGLLLVGHRLLQQASRKFNVQMPVHLGAFLSWGVTFALISLGWILFRSHNLDQALSLYSAVISPSSYGRLTLRPNFYVVTFLIVSGYFVFVGLEALAAQLRSRSWFERVKWVLSPVKYAALLLLAIIYSKHESVFVYLQF